MDKGQKKLLAVASVLIGLGIILSVLSGSWETVAISSLALAVIWYSIFKSNQ